MWFVVLSAGLAAAAVPAAGAAAAADPEATLGLAQGVISYS